MSKTVLIVEDDPEDINLLTEAFSEIDPAMEFLTAHNGLEALTILDKSTIQPHLIILDMNLPKMNGINCLAEIKKDKRYTGIPVVLFSSTFLHYSQDALKDLGANYCIKKPNNYGELRTTSLFFYSLLSGK
ncbi:MAG TPA: response regulator [Bacteroidia bacterium]|nr:response regulator [Bacteroidia bacterium]